MAGEQEEAIILPSKVQNGQFSAELYARAVLPQTQDQ